MKILHIIAMLCGFIATLQADDFTQRYGVNSQIYDVPLYFTRNQNVACNGKERIRHAKRVVYKNGDAAPCAMHDVCCEERTSIEALDDDIQVRSQALIAEKSAQMHHRQEALERERKQLETELASLRTTP